VTSTEEATSTEAATFNNSPSAGVTKEVDDLVASTTEEEEGTLVTGEGSNVSAGSTNPTEVWTLRPNWSTGGSTLQEEETTVKVLTTNDETTEVTSSSTERVTAIGESVTTVAVETAAENITPIVTETVKDEDIIILPVTEAVSLIDAASLFIDSETVTEESSTESARADLTNTTAASVTAEDDDSSVTTENAVTTEQSDKKDFPEVKLEREENEVEIDAESEKETSVGEEEFGAEQPRAFS